ncbi:MAG: DUF2169 domain-containing protein [Planctomycetales bacterium]|nr:DUF2169 domain-containing protein [Planctomycetales bacterium]
MDLINRTPFSPFVFEALDIEGDRSTVIALRGTFRIQSQSVLIPIANQRPCIIADRYSDKPGCSVLISESDLVPIKHKIDVFINGNAVASAGVAKQQWECGLSIGGNTRLSLSVTGPRQWVYGMLTGWQLSRPDSTKIVSLDYSNCFGGVVVEPGGTRLSFEENPIGCGFTTRSLRRSNRESVRAPQIETPSEPINEIERNYRPVCFAPIPKAWPQRLKMAGTYDDNWIKDRWPNWPHDFDATYFNAAHPDLQLDDLNPDEKFLISGMHENGQVTFRLPAYEIFAEVRDEFGTSDVVMHCDTVDIDMSKMEVGLVWRGVDLRMAPVTRVSLSISGEGVRFHAG